MYIQQVLKQVLQIFQKKSLLVFTVSSVAILLAATCSLASSTPSDPNEHRRVIFLPFTLKGVADQRYISEGLTNVLANRVASRANVIAVAQTKETAKMKEALQTSDFSNLNRMLEESGADFLVVSTLSPKNNQYEVASYVFSRTVKRAPQRASYLFADINDPIPAVDALAWEVSKSISSTNKETKVEAAASGAPGMSAFATAHPERAYRDSLLTGAMPGMELGGGFEIVQNLRSRDLSLEIMDLNAGDIDGDGEIEIVVLSKTALIVYRYREGQFLQVSTQDLPNYLSYHVITLADANKNGRPELYIGASAENRPASMVLEWQGDHLVSLASAIPYYIQATGVQGEVVIVGQAPSPGEIGGGSLYQMRYNDKGALSADTPIPLPAGYNVYDIAPADLDGDGKAEFIAINQQDRLQVFNSSGSLLWTSADNNYGASQNYYGTPSAVSSSSKEPVYLHTRIVTADIDHDGVTDVLVGKNVLETVSLFPNLRYFKRSSVAALKWEESGLRVLWETKEGTRYIPGYQVLPLANKKNEIQILFAETENPYPFQFWSSATSNLYRYQLKVNGENHR